MNAPGEEGPMNRTNIVAQFHSEDEAVAVVPQLRIIGVRDIVIERLGNNEDEGLGVFPNFVTALNVGSVNIPAITNNVVPSAGVLAAAADRPEGRDAILTGVVEHEEDYEKAAKAIRKAGGVIEDGQAER